MRTRLDKVPIAWANLTHNHKNLANALAGITFAVLLMFMQVGFLNSLLDSTVQFLKILDGDLFLISKQTASTSDNEEPFARARVFQARRFPGVLQAHYVHLDRKFWKNTENHLKKNIRVVAIDPDVPVFLDPEINSQLEDLKKDDVVLVDRLSKKHFGPITKGVRTEIEDRMFSVVGNFTLGTDFGHSGTVIMSDKNFLNLFKDEDELNAERKRVELGLIKIDPATNLQRIQEDMRKEFAQDLLVLTREEIIAMERYYWLEGTPVGFVFGLGTVMGFIVGTIICYQVLFTDILNRLQQFATIKAIGYSNRYLVGTVVRQSLILAVLGFLPGLLLSQVIYHIISRLLHLPMNLGEVQVILVLGLTLVMSAGSGLIAARKILDADPAELF